MRDALRLMLVTDPVMTAGRGLLETVLAAVEGGATSVQLRDKHTDDRTMLETARAVKAVLWPYRVPLIINDRITVAKEAGAEGLHMGQSDGDPTMARALLGRDVFIGLSVTSEDEIATVDPAVVDYAGVGPVFSTSTKPDASDALGIDGTARLMAALPVPSIAIGGIDAASTGAIIKSGAAGVAVVSAICAAEDPHAAARQLRTIIDGELQ